MTRRPPIRRRRRALTGLLVPASLVLIAVVGLALLGRSLGWFGQGPAAPSGAPPGTVAVPAVAVAIPTYARVRLEHLIDPRTGDLRAVYLPEGSLLPDTLVDAEEIIGRVVATDKRPGQLFSRSDFFPPGTREGMVAGIPPGKRALRIDARKVNGIVGLARGDRFDLVATLDFAGTRSGRVQVEGTAVGDLGAMGLLIESSMVVEDGAVVQPLETRAIPGRTAQLVEEMVIAVDPGEVAVLTKALHSGARIDCVPRSGRPIDGVAETPADAGGRPRSGRNRVETISGGKRRVVAVPFGATSDSATPTTSGAEAPVALDQTQGGR